MKHLPLLLLMNLSLMVSTIYTCMRCLLCVLLARGSRQPTGANDLGKLQHVFATCFSLVAAIVLLQ